VANTIKDAFSLWLNQHTSVAEKIAELALNNNHSLTPINEGIPNNVLRKQHQIPIL
jgi:topoisomerase-4 subunit B